MILDAVDVLSLLEIMEDYDPHPHPKSLLKKVCDLAKSHEELRRLNMDMKLSKGNPELKVIFPCPHCKVSNDCTQIYLLLCARTTPTKEETVLCDHCKKPFVVRGVTRTEVSVHKPEVVKCEEQ